MSHPLLRPSVDAEAPVGGVSPALACRGGGLHHDVRAAAAHPFPSPTLQHLSDQWHWEWEWEWVGGEWVCVPAPRAVPAGRRPTAGGRLQGQRGTGGHMMPL